MSTLAIVDDALSGAVMALWCRVEAATTRADVVGKVLKKSEQAMIIPRSQRIAASIVAEALLEERERGRTTALRMLLCLALCLLPLAAYGSPLVASKASLRPDPPAKIQ